MSNLISGPNVNATVLVGLRERSNTVSHPKVEVRTEHLDTAPTPLTRFRSQSLPGGELVRPETKTNEPRVGNQPPPRPNARIPDEIDITESEETGSDDFEFEGGDFDTLQLYQDVGAFLSDLDKTLPNEGPKPEGRQPPPRPNSPIPDEPEELILTPEEEEMIFGDVDAGGQDVAMRPHGDDVETFLDDLHGDGDRLEVRDDVALRQLFDPRDLELPLDPEMQQFEEMGNEIRTILTQQTEREQQEKIDVAVGKLFAAREESRSEKWSIGGAIKGFIQKVVDKISDYKERKAEAKLTTDQRIDRIHEKLAGGPSKIDTFAQKDLLLDLFSDEANKTVIPRMNDDRNLTMVGISNSLTKIIGDIREFTKAELGRDASNEIEKDPVTKKLSASKKEALIEKKVNEQLAEATKRDIRAFVKDLVANASQFQRSTISVDALRETLEPAFLFVGHKEKQVFVNALVDELEANPVELDPQRVKTDKLDHDDRLAVGELGKFGSYTAPYAVQVAGITDIRKLSNELTGILKSVKQNFHNERTNPDNLPWLEFLGNAARHVVINSTPGELQKVGPENLEAHAHKFEEDGRTDKAQFCLTLANFIRTANESVEGIKSMMLPKVLTHLREVKDENTFFRNTSYNPAGNLMQALGKPEHGKLLTPILKNMLDSKDVKQLDSEMNQYQLEQDKLELKKPIKKKSGFSVDDDPLQDVGKSKTHVSEDLATRVVAVAEQLLDRLLAVQLPQPMVAQLGEFRDVLTHRGTDVNDITPQKANSLVHKLYSNELMLRHIVAELVKYKQEGVDNPVDPSNVKPGEKGKGDVTENLSSPSMRLALDIIQKVANGITKPSAFKTETIGEAIAGGAGERILNKIENYFVQAGMPEGAKVQWRPRPQVQQPPVDPQQNQNAQVQQPPQNPPIQPPNVDPQRQQPQIDGQK